MPTITTNRRPDAVPMAVSMTVMQAWLAVAEAPLYDVPRDGFTAAGEREDVPGVIEIVAPVLVANVSNGTAWVSVRVTRKNGLIRTLVHRVPVPVNDVLPLPLAGQFILEGDRLEVQAQADNALHLTMSYTVGMAEVEV